MPGLRRADTAVLAGDYDESRVIAHSQATYVYEVFERCPRWRWLKRKRLAQALGVANRVREINDYTAELRARRQDVIARRRA